MMLTMTRTRASLAAKNDLQARDEEAEAAREQMERKIRELERQLQEEREEHEAASVLRASAERKNESLQSALRGSPAAQPSARRTATPISGCS